MGRRKQRDLANVPPKIELFEGELFVIPKGVEHCAKAEEEAAFVIVGLNITSNKPGGKPDWSYTNKIGQKPM